MEEVGNLVFLEGDGAIQDLFKPRRACGRGGSAAVNAAPTKERRL
jgi:hypothetical protein